MLERLVPIDQHHGYLVFIAFLEFPVIVDIDLFKPKEIVATGGSNARLGLLTKVTPRAAVDGDDVVSHCRVRPPLGGPGVWPFRFYPSVGGACL